MWPPSRFAQADLHRALHQGATGGTFAYPLRDDLPLEALSQQYLIELVLRGKKATPNLHSHYRGQVRRWCEICQGLGVHPLQARAEHVQAYVDGLIRAGRSPQAIETKLSSISSMYLAWRRAGLLEHNPARAVTAPRFIRKTTKNPLSRTEARAVLDAADAHPDPQAAAVTHLLLQTGIRREDLLSLDLADIGTREVQMTLELRHRKLGGHDLISVPDAVRDRLLVVIGQREHGPLFLNRASTRLHGESLYPILDQVAATAGVQAQRVRPHVMRVTFITLSMDAGVPTREIMASVGHQSEKMTHYYDQNRIALDQNASGTLTRYLGY